MFKQVVVFAAEPTPLYLPLYVAREIGAIRAGGTIDIRFPDSSVKDGDEWAADQLCKAIAKPGSCKERYYAICDPVKILNDKRDTSIAVIGSLISKAALWHVGHTDSLNNMNNGAHTVFTYPSGMSAFTIAKTLFADNATTQITPVSVDHELCNMLVASDKMQSSSALTANLIAALRFKRLHRRDGFDKVECLAKNARYTDFFLTGILGCKTSAQHKVTCRFLRQLRDSIRWIHDEPARASRILANLFSVGATEASDVITEFIESQLYGALVPEVTSWRRALEVLALASSTPMTAAELDARTEHTFQECIVTEVALKVKSQSGRLKLWSRRMMMKFQVRLDEVSESIESRGIIAKMIRWTLVEGVLVALIGCIVGVAFEYGKAEVKAIWRHSPSSSIQNGVAAHSELPRVGHPGNAQKVPCSTVSEGSVE
jgi:hypothetical protein